ncbi:formimidoylglutamase [Macrococcoides caseolyticum]|uniref:formimidoylglutamase n=1 Tax=Macrococcoides caseolyticum TaxID=69966 RepID=UPI001F2FAE38|nr:formimidoylglutamase [Macrococcus caseolyticus]MCE4956039.1 formimidoylglutamase [Macrococcus caseolyticus]
MFHQTDMSIWRGRLDHESDNSHFRIFQSIHNNPYIASDYAILGYAIDEGVRLNKGRIGAKQGPETIRRAFANLPNLSDRQFIDYGNYYCEDESLLDVQKQFGDKVADILHKHKMTFLIGGGHDIAYAQYLGMRKLYTHDSIGVINIDAHFDTRYEEYPTSGTSFSYILEDGHNNGYLVLGVQRAGNTKALFEYAEQKNIDYILADDLQGNMNSVIEKIDSFIEQYDHILLTLCMDVIDSAYAPGVSAPAVFGLTPFQVNTVLQTVMKSEKVNNFSIAEMNPKYDIDQRTAKLIAQIMHRTIF